MPDPSLSQAIKEAYAAAPSDVVILHTLELRHPAFKDDEGQPTAIRVVRDHVDLSARLEPTAPLDGGAMVTFVALAFDLSLPPIDTAPVPEITVTLDNVSREIVRHLDAAVATQDRIEMTYRPYLSTDKEGPQMQARAIDDQGVATGSWITLGSETYSDATNTAQRQSFKYAVTPGRYEVQLQRLDTKDASSRAGHEIRWGGLRSYLDGTPDFGDLTILAVKMRATDNLSQRSARMINCIVTRKLPTWEPTTGWSAPVPTRSIAWAFADACRAQYGAKLADGRIDLNALHTLDQTWAARGDEFNGIFDSSMTVWEALTRISRCGRAVPVLQGGVVRLYRDAAQTLPVAMFGPRNIVKGSFKIQYVMPGEETADAVTVTFFNSRTWKPDEVTSSLADSAAEQPAKVALFGCTDAAQAKREGLYMAADNRYRRKLVSWSTELEGMIPTYGDLVAITHDMPHWGQGGEVVAWDDQAEVLTVSEPLTWESGAGHYIALRRRDGSLAGPFLAEAIGENDRLVHVLEPLDFTPYTDTSEERTHFAFGAGDAWGAKARVIAVKPRGENVEITAVAEDARVHQADLAA